MAETKENQKKEVEIPRWQFLQNESITRATNLIKEHGANVEFLVIAVRNHYHNSDDFKSIFQFLETSIRFRSYGAF